MQSAERPPPERAQDAPGAASRSYWRSVLRRTVLLLAVWFAAGPLLGILLADALNRWTVVGMPAGFWMAQQGSIYVFVALIFLYAALSERADRRRDASPVDAR